MKCPHCGQFFEASKLNDDAAAILTLMESDSKRREIYQGRNGRWYITYGGGEISYSAIKQLLDAGHIRPTYLGVLDCFTAGKTFDMDRTLERRKETGRKDILVYVE